MAECEIGQLVYSKCGRDKKMMFVVVDILDEYVFLCDGVLRKLVKPKKKKLKHIQPINYVNKEIQLAILGKCHIKDSDIRKVLTEFMNSKFI